MQEFMMFSVPLLPRLPTFLTPSSLLAPLKSFLTQPTAIDYTSIPLLPTQTFGTEKRSTVVHSGPMANLPKSTCPICHLRFTSAPVPLDPSTSSGSAINLPPIQSVFTTDLAEGESKEETRIYVPAQTDCWGACRWCYYCIAGELAKHRGGLETRRRNRPAAKKEEEEKWTCLRCGGGATRAWRVGADVTENKPNGNIVASS